MPLLCEIDSTKITQGIELSIEKEYPDFDFTYE